MDVLAAILAGVFGVFLVLYGLYMIPFVIIKTVVAGFVVLCGVAAIGFAFDRLDIFP